MFAPGFIASHLNDSFIVSGRVCTVFARREGRALGTPQVSRSDGSGRVSSLQRTANLQKHLSHLHRPHADEPRLSCLRNQKTVRRLFFPISVKSVVSLIR